MSDVAHDGLRADLASGRQDRLFQIATVSTPKARLEREFDPQPVRDLMARLPHDVSVGGPTIAAHAIRTGLVDEYGSVRRAYYYMIGGRKRSCPATLCIKLDLLDERHFPNAKVYLRDHNFLN